MSLIAAPSINSPIGVFDSGVGGLSVLRQLLQHLPQEDMVYLADSAWAPYGERSPEQIAARSLHIANYLQQHHHIKALVVACNTATSHAVQQLRQQHPQLPLIGIEPAIKPAVALSKTGHIGIMATRATVQGAKFARLVQDWGGESHIHVQACDGLALAIENALEGQSNPDGQTVQSLCRCYWAALQTAASRAASTAAGTDSHAAPGAIDVLVLGCTHYPFAADVLQTLAGESVQLIEPGEPVALHTQRLLQQHGLLRAVPVAAAQPAGTIQQAQKLNPEAAAQQMRLTQTARPKQEQGESKESAHAAAQMPATSRLTLLSTSNPQRLQRATQQWLGIQAKVRMVAL